MAGNYLEHFRIFLRKVSIRTENPAKPRNGYFHQWVLRSYQDEGCQQNESYALIEFEDGRVEYIAPEKITFVDSFDAV